jgi:hypothetical protein
MTPKTPRPLADSGQDHFLAMLAPRGNTPPPEQSEAEGAAALLLLKPPEPRKRTPKPKTPAATGNADRARPGPRPQSKFMGVTRHVKGMWVSLRR